jgi:hypothetical protein
MPHGEVWRANKEDDQVACRVCPALVPTMHQRFFCRKHYMRRSCVVYAKIPRYIILAKSLEPKSRRKEFTYDVSEKTAESTAITRRQALSKGAKVAIGAAAVVVAGGAIGYYAMQGPPPAVTTTTTAPATTLASTSTMAQPFAGQTLKWL